MRLMTILVGLCFMLVSGSQSAMAQEGNSDAAHACQKGGYAALVGTGGETFRNAGQCASFVARGGTFATGIIVPAGQTVTFNDPAFSACNALVYGYTVQGSSTQLGSKPAGCANIALGDVTIGPFPTAVILTVYLEDQTCGATYASDGNHALVVSSPPVYQVDIADGGPGCNRVNSPVSGFTAGNLSVDVIINP